MIGLAMWCVLGLQAQSPAAVPSATTTEAAREDPAVTALALTIYKQMRAGKVDPALLTEAAGKMLTPGMLASSKPVFDQLGNPTKLVVEKKETVPQGTKWEYLVTFPTAQLHLDLLIDSSGKVAAYLLKP